MFHISLSLTYNSDECLINNQDFGQINERGLITTLYHPDNRVWPRTDLAKRLKKKVDAQHQTARKKRHGLLSCVSTCACLLRHSRHVLTHTHSHPGCLRALSWFGKLDSPPSLFSRESIEFEDERGSKDDRVQRMDLI